MPQSDLTISLVLGEPHEAGGAIALERHEKVGAFDGRRWRIEVALEVVGIRSFSRSSSVSSALEAAQEMATGPGRRSILIDVTKAGRGALRAAEEVKLKVTPVVIGESIGAKIAQRMIVVGRLELVTALAGAIEADRLRVTAPDAAELGRQLASFTTARRTRAEQPVPPRDELVLALGLAVWWAMRLRPLTSQPRPPRQPIASPPLTWDAAAAATARRIYGKAQ